MSLPGITEMNMHIYKSRENIASPCINDLLIRITFSLRIRSRSHTFYTVLTDIDCSRFFQLLCRINNNTVNDDHLFLLSVDTPISDQRD